MGFQRLKSKKGVELKIALFAVIAVGLFVVAATVNLQRWDVTDAGPIYESGISTQAQQDLQPFDSSDEISTQIEADRQSISQSSGAEGDAEGNIFQAVFGIVVIIPKTLNLVFGSNGMLDALATRFGIENYVIVGVATLMSIALIWAIIAIVFRRGIA